MSGREEYVREVERRVSQASGGPWIFDQKSGKIYRRNEESTAVATFHAHGQPGKKVSYPLAANARFACHARDDVPWLLERIRELARQRTDLRAGVWLLAMCLAHERSKRGSPGEASITSPDAPKYLIRGLASAKAFREWE